MRTVNKDTNQLGNEEHNVQNYVAINDEENDMPSRLVHEDMDVPDRSHLGRGGLNGENTSNEGAVARGEEDKNDVRTKKFVFCLTNARSLWAKTESLYEVFEELEVDCTVVSETWFHDCEDLDQLVCDADKGKGLAFLNNVRKIDGRKNRGGGVSIVSKKSTMSVKKFPAKLSGCEIVVGKAKIRDNTRPMFIIGAYLSTRLKPVQVTKFIETIVDIIMKIKTSTTNPYLLIAGDFNRADVSPILADYPDMKLASVLPTRADAALDLIITNFDDEIETRSPLQNGDDGVFSDHNVVICVTSLSHSHEFDWIERRYRPMKPDAVEKAAKRIKETVWDDILPTMEQPDFYVEQFHRTIVEICEQEIPWKKERVRSTDDPWISKGIRKRVDQRKAVFRRSGRSANWKVMKKSTRKMIKKSRSEFYDREVNKMKPPGLLPFKAIAALKDKERPKTWSLSSLYPEKSDEETMEEAATFFTKISHEFEPLRQEDLPETYEKRVGLLTVQAVGEALKEMKKPKSYVSIDVPPAVLALCIDEIAHPITPILNLIRTSKWWPRTWKSEEVSIIPKTSHPESIEQTRNISCTSTFSKLAEHFMLLELQGEVHLPPHQYGGKKGCGTENLLCELSTDIMIGLDDNRAAVGLMSLDYAKAFNRMSHRHCLDALAKGGASSQTLRMVYSFLEGHTMRIKFNGKFSSCRDTPGGVPQGTKSGNFLFAVTADQLGREDVARAGPFVEDDRGRMAPFDESSLLMDRTELDSSLEGTMNVARTDGRIGKKTTILNDTEPNALLGTWPRDRIEAELGLPPRWRNRLIKNYCYVDDQTQLEVLPRDLAVSSIGVGKEKRFAHAQGLQRKYCLIDCQSKDIGMQLNLHKTQLLCIGCPLSCEISAYININGTIIESTDRMKILGYTFGNKPNANLQVESIRKTVAYLAWAIRHLKRAGIPSPHLIEIYCCFIRALIEYGANTYGGYLTRQQSDELERLQANILRSILGTRRSYSTCLRISGLDTLEKRREFLFAKFADRIEKNVDFRKRWLPLAPVVPHDLRAQDKYIETKANCTRLQNSPIYRLRSLLNKLHRRGECIEDEIERIRSGGGDDDGIEPDLGSG